MDNVEHGKIPRSTIIKLARLLPVVGVDYSSRDYDADLFRTIDPRPVQRATVMDNDVTLSALPVDAFDAKLRCENCCLSSMRTGSVKHMPQKSTVLMAKVSTVSGWGVMATSAPIVNS